MAKHLPSLPMSHIIACDSPLLSPLSADHHWDIQQPLFSPIPDFNYTYYLPPSPPSSEGSHSPASPIPTSKMLKMSMAPGGAAEMEQLCLPTHQVFDIPEDQVSRPPTPSSRSPSLAAETDPSVVGLHSATTSCGAKRSASPAPSVTKKRAVGERIHSKDFIPPDVSGLSKREARLVKNRAAAFLSRQRKREEFECMEIRVAELEQENARLLVLAQNGSPSEPQQAQSDTELVSEVEQLKAELAAAKERERSLSAQLATKVPTREVPIKVEATEPHFSFSSPPRPTVASAHKSGASLGLMVLLCALPTLLSMRMQPAAQTSFAIPNPFPTTSTSAFDYSSILPHNDYDWSAKTTASALMDLDGNDHHTVPGPRKLELTGADVAELDGLGNLDISFDASPSDDGKIRVRIHPSSTASSSWSTSPGATDITQKSDISSSSPSLAMWSGSGSESRFQSSFSSQSSGVSSFSTPSSDPFLGVASSDYEMPFTRDDSKIMYENDFSSSLDYGQLSDPTFGIGSEYTLPDCTGGKRRVRIALKSMPQAGGEGGEWEVQIC